MNTPVRHSDMARILKGSQFYLHTAAFICQWNETYLPFPSQLKLVLINRPKGMQGWVGLELRRFGSVQVLSIFVHLSVSSVRILKKRVLWFVLGLDQFPSLNGFIIPMETHNKQHLSQLTDWLPLQHETTSNVKYDVTNSTVSYSRLSWLSDDVWLSCSDDDGSTSASRSVTSVAAADVSISLTTLCHTTYTAIHISHW